MQISERNNKNIWGETTIPQAANNNCRELMAILKKYSIVLDVLNDVGTKDVIVVNASAEDFVLQIKVNSSRKTKALIDGSTLPIQIFNTDRELVNIPPDAIIKDITYTFVRLANSFVVIDTELEIRGTNETLPVDDSVGLLTYSASSIIPITYLLCDGSEVAKADYPDLFALIGSTYGKAENTDNFKLPLYNNVFFVYDNDTGKANELIEDTNPPHTHPVKLENSGKHRHSYPVFLGNSKTYNGVSFYDNNEYTKTYWEGGLHTHNLTFSLSYPADNTEFRPPSMFLRPLIKARTDIKEPEIVWEVDNEESS